METYGVSFEGFEPSCGWPSHNSWTEKIIPREKFELVRWGKILEDRQKGLATIREARSELAAVKSGCQKLLAGLRGRKRAKSRRSSGRSMKSSGSRKTLSALISLLLCGEVEPALN